MPVIDRWVVDATIVDTHPIGAGGGSIARVNELIANRVEVGPESAGSMPGPAAYNQGGLEPTVTDADVVLGYINPDYFHGGAIKLSRRRAERAIRNKIAEPLGASVEDAALMIKRIVLFDPVSHQYLRDYDAFNRTVAGLEEEARRDFLGEGCREDQIEYTLELDMKFGGQLNVKRVTSPVLRIRDEADAIAIREAFEREYSQAYSPMGLNPEAGIEISNFVVRGRVRQAQRDLPRHELEAAGAAAASVGSRQAYWADLGWVTTPVFRQERLRPGTTIAGPAIIEAENTTLLVEPEWTYTVGQYMEAILQFAGEPDSTGAALARAASAQSE